MGKWSWVGPAIAGVAGGIIIGAIIFSPKKKNYPSIEGRITPHDPEVRNKAIQIVKESGDKIISQLFDIFDYMRGLKYVSDPLPEHVALPCDTLKAGGGDCDDFAVTTASLIKAVGREARVVKVTNNEIGHAFCEVLIDNVNNMNEVLAEIKNRYGGNYTIGWESDLKGNWLLFDTLLPAPGYLISNFISSQNGSWKFINSPQYYY